MLSPAAHVVVLLCGVESLNPLIELVPLNGDECTQISSEQDASEYLSTVMDTVRKGMEAAYFFLKSLTIYCVSTIVFSLVEDYRTLGMLILAKVQKNG